MADTLRAVGSFIFFSSDCFPLEKKMKKRKEVKKMNIFAQLAEKTAELSTADCIWILFLLLMAFIMVGVLLWGFITLLKAGFEEYVERLVCKQVSEDFGYFRKYDVPKIVSDELKKRTFNGSAEYYSPKLKEKMKKKW